MTAMRDRFEREILPCFASRFVGTDMVLNLGAGDHAYRDAFPCRVVTSDRNPAAGCDETFAAEAIPYPDDTLAGLLMMGVFERLDDPMRAVREIRRAVRPGGFVLLSLLDLGLPWRKPVDRWRVSAGGAAHIVRDFTIVREDHVRDEAHFYTLQKPVTR